MAEHTEQIPGQRPQTPAPAPHAPTTEAPTPPGPATEPSPRLAALRAWWNGTWSEGGTLHSRWEDLRKAPELGWHRMATWLKVALATAGISLFVLLLANAAGALLDTSRHLLPDTPRGQVGADTSTGIWGVIDNPVRSYIATHSHGLTVSASTVCTLWQLAGLYGFVGGLARLTGARITWTLWGAATTAMVWSTTPDHARTIAIGITVLAWTIASTLALRGLSLRPSLFIRTEIRPRPADDTPDNAAHHLQR